MFWAKLTLWALMHAAQLVAPLNTQGVATNCDNSTIQCTYTDTTVVPGNTYSYFCVAEDFNGHISAPSNTATAVVASNNSVVVLTWQPSGPNITYFLYRNAPSAPPAPPTAVTVTGSN